MKAVISREELRNSEAGQAKPILLWLDSARIKLDPRLRGDDVHKNILALGTA